MNAKLSILLILFTFIFLSGCLEQSTPLAHKKAVVQQASYQDLDDDGIPNVWYYSFKPIDQNGLSIRKEITVTGMEKDPNFIVQNNYRRKEDLAQNYYDELSKMAVFTPKCIYAIDEVIPCDSEEQCINICKSKVRCNNGMNKYPSLNTSLYPFSVSLDRVKDDAASMRESISSKSYVSQAELDTILLERDAFISDIDELLNNHVFENNLCSQLEYENLKLLLEDVDSIYERDVNYSKKQMFFAYTKYKIFSKTSYSYDENAVVEVDEVIPQSFAKSKPDIKFIISPEHVSTSVPITVRYMLDFRKIEQTKSDFAYETVTNAADWDTEMQSITYPTGTVKVLQLENFGPYVSLRNTFYSVLGALRQHMSLGFAVSITVYSFLLAAYLIIILLRLVYEAFVTASRHEHIVEAVYKIAGHGATGRKELIAIVVICLGIGAYIINYAGEPIGEDVIEVLLANQVLLSGVLVFSVGMFALYFLVADVVKSIVLGKRYVQSPTIKGIHSVVVEKHLKKELLDMRSRIGKLEESAKVAGMPVDKKRIKDLLKHISLVEQLITKGKLDDAESHMAKYVRNMYSEVCGDLAAYADEKKVIDEMKNDVKDEIDQIDHLYSEALNNGVRIDRVDWISRLNKCSDILQQQGFVDAQKYLQNLTAEIKKEEVQLREKIEKVKHLKFTRFPCPVCGRMTSLASDACESCGVPLNEGFNEKLTSLKHELDSVAMELREKDVKNSGRMVNSVDVLITHLNEYLSQKKYYKASNLISTIEEKIRHLNEILSNAVSKEVELVTSMSEIGQLIDSIPKVISKAKEYNLDISAYEKRYNAFGGKAKLSELKKMPIDDALVKAKDLLSGYKEIESDLKNMIAKYALSVNALERVNELFTDASTQITMAKGLGINVSDYSKRLESLNIDGLISSIENNEVDVKDLESTVSNLSKMVDELKAKVSSGKRLYALVKSTENSMHLADELVEICKQGGLFPFDEMEQLNTIDLSNIKDRISELRLDEVDSINSKLIQISTRVNSIVLRLKKKKEILSAWPTWKSMIERMLKNQDRIEPSMLGNVPPQWRPWVVEKFVSETNLPVVLENNTLVKLKPMKGISKSDISKVLSDMISTGRILGGVILRKDGLVISSNLPEGRNANSIAAMAATAMQKAESASTALDKGIVSHLIFNASKGKQVTVRAGEFAIITAIIKPDEDLGFVVLAMKKAAEKVKNLISKL